MGTTYEKYPRPNADMHKGPSAKKVSTPSKGGQDRVSGAMGKHQNTGSGEYGSSHKGSSHKGSSHGA